MTGLRDLLASERGVWCLLLLALATALALARFIEPAMWVSLVLQLSALLVASKTVTTAVDARRS